MPFRIRCSRCGKTVKAGDDWAGLDGNCPACGQTVSFRPTLPSPPAGQVEALFQPDFGADSQRAPSPAHPAVIPGENPVDDGSSLPTWIWGTLFIFGLCILMGIAVAVRQGMKQTELRMVQDANRQVAELVRSASDSLDRGQIQEAESAIDSALSIKIATEKDEANRLLVRLAETRAKLETEELFHKAENALDQLQVEEAKDYLNQYVNNPNPDLPEKAKALQAELEMVTANDEAVEILRRMNPEEFAIFEAVGKLPPAVKFSRDSLSAIFAATLSAALPQERIRRKAEQERISAEREKVAEAEAETLLTSRKRKGDDFRIEITELAIVPSPYWSRIWQRENESGNARRSWKEFCDNLGGESAMDRLKITVSATNLTERKILNFQPQEDAMNSLNEKLLLSRIGLRDDVDNYISNHSDDAPDARYVVNVHPKETISYSLFFDVPQKGTKFVLLKIEKEVINFNFQPLSTDDLLFKIQAAEIKKEILPIK